MGTIDTHDHRQIVALEVGLNIDDPINTFAVGDVRILEILRSIYEGYCFKSVLITEVIRIVKRSECIITAYGDPSGGQISVIMECAVITYDIGDVIMTKIIKRTAHNIAIGISDHAHVVVSLNNPFGSVREGDTIPVIVGIAKYPIKRNKITISAAPWRPSIIHDHWITSLAKSTLPKPPLVQDDDPVMGRLYHEISMVNVAKDKYPDRWDEFMALFSIGSIEKDKDMKTSTIADINKKGKFPNPCSVTIVPLTDKTLEEPALYYKHDVVKEVVEGIGDTNAVMVYDETIIKQFITMHIRRLRLLRLMLETYGPDDEYKRHSHLWKIYKL